MTVLISGTKEAVDAVSAEIAASPGSDSRVTERKNLAGGGAEWIVVATLVVNTLPHIFGVLKDHVAANRVKRIKVGEIEIDNPTPEMVELLLRKVETSPAT